MAHLLEYAILGFLVHRAFGSRGILWLAAAAAIASLIGGIDEIYQSTVPGRVSSMYDWLADTAGGAFGATLGWLRGVRRIGSVQNRERGIE